MNVPGLALRVGALAVSSLGFATCGGTSDPTEVASECAIETLPFGGSADAPVVTDVGLEVQGGGIVPVATASDPQGFDNVEGVLQSVGVYPDSLCEGVPSTVTDDLAGLGIEETFGVALTSSAAGYDAIAAATATWPVHVRFSDLDGNVTEGDILARLIR
jgi:hypothetical protein